MNTFKRRAVLSLISSYASQFATTVVNLGTKIVLARLIAPNELGDYTTALLLLMGCDLFIDLGVSQHLTRENDRPYGNVLLIRMTIASVFYVLIWTLGSKLTFWGNELPTLLRVLGIGMIFKAASYVPNIYLDREMLVHRSILPQVWRLIITGAVSIYMAVLHFGVWALVYGAVAGEAAFAVAIWHSAWGRIPIELTWKHSLQLIWGSRFLFLIAFMGFGLQQGDVAVVRTVMGSTQLGYYTMAYMMIMMVSKVIETSIYRIIYPTFCEYKDRIEDLGKIYRQATLMITALEAPVYFFLLFNAPVVMPLLLGRKWIPAAIIMQALAVAGVVNPFSTFGMEILRARACDRMLALSTILSSVILVGSGYFLTRKFGVMGMVAANYIVVGSLPIILTVYKLVKTDFIKLSGQLAVVYISSFVLIAGVSLSLRSHPYIQTTAASLLIPVCWYTYYRVFGDSMAGRTIRILRTPIERLEDETLVQGEPEVTA